MSTFNSGLYIVSTPIGNLDDITLRSLEVLKKSDIILCEDTRRSLKLLNHYKIKKKLISYHKFNEQKELKKIIGYLNEGKILSLISDAGTPTLSDPGLLLVKTCIEEDIQIYPIINKCSCSISSLSLLLNDNLIRSKIERKVSSIFSILETYIFPESL